MLLALVIKRSGAELWEAALPQLIAVAAEGPVIQASRGQLALRHVGCQCGHRENSLLAAPEDQQVAGVRTTPAAAGVAHAVSFSA